MKAQLELDVRVRKFAVMAELALWERRRDLQALCHGASQQGVLNPPVIDAILPGLSPRAHQNLLGHLTYLGLVTPAGALTALGRRCATSGEAPALEQGVYRLIVAFHPFSKGDILGFERSVGEGHDRNFDDLEPLPPEFVVPPDRVFTSVFERDQRFSIVSFPKSSNSQTPLCRHRDLPSATLKWSIDLITGENQWSISGTTDDARQATYQSAPGAVDPGELAGIFEKWEPNWDPGIRRMRMAYDDTVAVGGRETFLREKTYPSVRIGAFGRFDDVTVSGVPVGPATKDEARRWALAIHIGRVEAADAYVTPADGRSGWEAAINDTPLALMAGRAPEPTDVHTVNARPLATRTRWLLVAATDLEMEV